MKKLIVLMLTSVLMLSGVSLFAQDKADTGTVKVTKPEVSYMMIGANMYFDYWLIEGSTRNYGLLMKLPIDKSNNGIQINVSSYDIPVSEHSYDTGTNIATGNIDGTEHFGHFGLSYLKFLKHASIPWQIVSGVDYYHYTGGEYFVKNSCTTPTVTSTDCGIKHEMCSDCIDNMFGVHVGINVDVPIYSKLYLMTSFMYKYLFIHHQNKAGVLEFSLGLGYMID